MTTTPSGKTYHAGKYEFTDRPWGSVEVGEELPNFTFGPLTETNMFRTASGTRDSSKHHHDTQYARDNGAPDKFLNTMTYQGLLGRYLTDWGGPDTFIRRLQFSMRSHNVPGDLLQFRGAITRKYEQDGRKLVDCEVRIDNQRNKDSVIANMTVELL